MSSDGRSDDEGADDEEEEDWPAAELPNEDEVKVQRKLHLFQNSSVQQSIRRLWDVLPKDDHGELTMEGYIEFNLRMQKTLTPEFVLERAVDSAIGDWSEDVREDQQAMTADEFAMFLFELCSLWCGPSVSLRVYLLFLNATFIAITDCRGAHTIGLKSLDDVQHLPKAFFDLLHMQGWSKDAEDDSSQTEEQALNAWYSRNLHPDNVQAAMLQIQRQVFQVTHDVRSVFLFRHQDGRKHDEPDVLDLVKHAASQLDKVSKADVPLRLPPASYGDSRSIGNGANGKLCALPWCPPMHSRVPGAPGTTAAASAAARAHAVESQKSGNSFGDSGSRANRRGRSAPGYPQQQSLSTSGSKSSQAVPVGRAFETRRTDTRARGLALAGQYSVNTGTASQSSQAIVAIEDKVGPLPSQGAATSSSSKLALQSAVPDATTKPSPSESQTGGEHQQSKAAFTPEAIDQTATWMHEEEAVHMSNFLEAQQLLPPYRLPKNPADLYQRQAEPLMKVRPASLVFETNKFQANTDLLGKPFDRVLKKLPENIRACAEKPIPGPMAHPNEPIWFEMGHQLQAILKKQGKRAERRRKRRLRSKLLRGRPQQPAKRSDGRDLRNYLDNYAAQRAAGHNDVPGQPAGEFLGKVHENYLMNRERLETKRFQVPGTGGGVVDKHTWGETASPRAARVVRPVYCPPPGMKMETA